MAAALILIGQAIIWYYLGTQVSKRYKLFVCERYYPGGGANDFHSSSQHKAILRRTANQLEGDDLHMHIYDSWTGQIEYL